MLSVLVFSLAVASGLCEMPHINKDVPKNFEPRIIQGEDAKEQEFPWMVSLNYNGDGHACGGSIVAPSWVLTAAHCCLTGNGMGIHAGSNYWGKGGQQHDIEKYVVHGDYNPDEHWRNDFCLIKIRDQFQFNDNTKQVTMPSDNFPVNDGEAVTISGWGYTRPGENIPDYLQVGRNFRALSNAKCQQETGVDVTDSYICAHGGKDGQGVCNGDSGSPLVKGNTQVGTASWVYLPCGSGSPDFYSRTSHAMPWIRQVLGSDAEQLIIADE